MFSPRLRLLKGHGMNRIYFVQSSTDECKFISIFTARVQSQ